jgi:hypothetical protein
VLVFAFILYGLLQPLGAIPLHRLVLSAAIFGSSIAILEFLTGGVPLGLATLIALIGLGRPPDWSTLYDRAAVGTAAFTAAVIACFGYKLLAVAAIFGTNELSVFSRRSDRGWEDPWRRTSPRVQRRLSPRTTSIRNGSMPIP